MSANFYQHLSNELDEIKAAGLYKGERVIEGQQSALIDVAKSGEVINLCANNYLGLANDPSLIKAGQDALETLGFGVASVRFICGTQNVHKQLEEALAKFLGTEDVVLYASCFDANGGLFETILGAEDAVISDALNHASIIDGVRLCKAKRYRYANNDMAALEEQLIKADADGARHKLIVTDGVFSMDGVIADLEAVCDLADKYDALVMVDDSHAVGFLGENGRGTHEYCNVIDRVDIITGTLGKALGGASGGYTAAKKEVTEMLRQRSRPYLFSNSLAPSIASSTLHVLDMVAKGHERRAQLKENAAHFRKRMTEAGFSLAGADHPIIPVMIGDAKKAADMSDELLKRGIYVIGFSFPVVPKGEARIRTQMSAIHTREQLDKAIDAFIEVGKAMEII